MAMIVQKILLVVFLSASAFAHGAAPKAATAVYDVQRDGKTIGVSTQTLVDNNDGTWTLHSVTKGSAGMAKLLGLDVDETSTFKWIDGKAQGVRYTYKQEAAIKHKERTIEFDRAAQKANVDDNGKKFSYAAPSDAIDRSTVSVAIGLLLADGTRDTTLPVAVKDHIKQQRYQARGEEKISVPAGTFQTTHVERTDVQGKASSWYAPTISALPVRIEQTQGDGSKIVMDLRQR
jgi:Protein of unknown function (DUF3108)